MTFLGESDSKRVRCSENTDNFDLKVENRFSTLGIVTIEVNFEFFTPVEIFLIHLDLCDAFITHYAEKTANFSHQYFLGLYLLSINFRHADKYRLETSKLRYLPVLVLLSPVIHFDWL